MNAEFALGDDFARVLTETTQALVCVLDRDGRILLFNDACERATGYGRDEVLGRNARELVIPPEEAEAFAELCELVNGAGVFDITQSDEHIEGAMVGLDPRLLRRLIFQLSFNAIQNPSAFETSQFCNVTSDASRILNDIHAASAIPRQLNSSSPSRPNSKSCWRWWSRRPARLRRGRFWV